MSRFKTEFCPNCGKWEFLRYPETALDYREVCSVCGETVVLPSDPAKALRVHEVVGTSAVSEEDWEKIFVEANSAAP